MCSGHRSTETVPRPDVREAAMEIFSFEKIARNDRAAERYLLDSCSRAGPIECASCGAGKLYVIENGARRRCARCGRSFRPWSGRWIGEMKISARKLLWIVKLFELDLNASSISSETAVSYPTVLRALDVIRRSIAGAPARGRSARRSVAGNEPLIGSLGASIPGVQIYRTVADDAIRCILPMAGGYIVGIDRSLSYASVSYRGEELPIVDRGERFPFWRVYCSAGTGFWQYAKERLAKHHGVSDAKLPLYIGEMEYRYLNRGRRLFDLLVERLCGRIDPPTRSLPLISD
jgi:transposase